MLALIPAGVAFAWGAAPAEAATSPYAQAVLADHPVAYWQFNDAAGSPGYADSSGHGHTLPAGPTTVVSPGVGNSDGAISTASGGTYTASPLSPLAGDAARTVEVWFKTTSGGCILNAGSAEHSRSFSLCFGGGPYNSPRPGAPGFYLQTWDADIFAPVANMTDGNWHYLALTLTGNTVNIVIDGSRPRAYIWNGSGYGGLAAQPFTLSSTPNTASSPLGIGTSGWTGGLAGMIDEVAVYPSALPVSELARHYQLSAGRNPAPPPASSCHLTGTPKVVVVLLMGLNSSLPSGPAYDVRSIDYCHIGASPNAQLRQLGATFDSAGTGSAGSTTLAGTIGQRGTVILPYSYLGAYFTGPDKFFAAGYSTQVPNASDVVTDAWTLDNELVSIRQQWPSAHIVVIGHSLGGLIAKQWWRNWDGHHDGAADHASRSWNISAVFSLDGPINGGSAESAQWTPAGNCPYNFGPVPASMLPCGLLAQEFLALWDNYALHGDDTAMAQADVGDRGIYTPIGTYGDIVMEILRGPVGINDNGEELGVQLFAAFDSDGTVNTLLQPGTITGQDAHAWQGLDSHGVVYRDQSNIALIAAAIRAAAGPVTARSGRPGARPPGVLTAERTLAARPAAAARLASVIARGGVVRITGTRLGVSAGSLWVYGTNGSTPCTILKWTTTAASCKVAANAQSGYVLGMTSGGLPFFAGAVLVPAAAPVAAAISIRAPDSGQAAAGTSQPVTFSVTDKDGLPVAGARVAAMIGDSPANATTGTNGTVTIPAAGQRAQTVVAVAGQQSATAAIGWRPDPIASLTIIARAVRGSGGLFRVTATARNSSGAPAADVALVCGVSGPPGLSPAGQRSCTTDRAGTARLSVRGHAPDMAVAYVATADGAHQASTPLRWPAAVPARSGSPAGRAWLWTALSLGALLVAAVAAAVFVRRRVRPG